MAEGSTPHTLGDGPVQPEFASTMRVVAQAIDSMFNGPLDGDEPKKVGFVILVFPFGDETEGHRCNYMSNAERGDVVKMLKEQIKHFEGQDAG